MVALLCAFFLHLHKVGFVTTLRPTRYMWLSSVSKQIKDKIQLRATCIFGLCNLSDPSIEPMMYWDVRPCAVFPTKLINNKGWLP
jgi:hypothetical protein